MEQAQNPNKTERPWKKRIAKPDLLLILCLLLIGSAGLIIVRIRTGQNGASVRITTDGILYGTYDLAAEASIEIQTDGHVTNILSISGGKAQMAEANCPDKLCIHQNAISRQGETIVCLPNKIVVEVEGQEDAEFDSISR